MCVVLYYNYLINCYFLFSGCNVYKMDVDFVDNV